MLSDETRRRLRKLNHTLLDARHIIETWPEDEKLWHLPEWQSSLDDIIRKAIEYQGPDATPTAGYVEA
jgi:hypothetical protein